MANFATQSSGPHANSITKLTIEFCFTCFNLEMNFCVVDIHGWSGGASSERNQPSLSASRIWCVQQIVSWNYSTTYTVKGLRMFRHNHSQQFLTRSHQSNSRFMATTGCCCCSNAVAQPSLGEAPLGFGPSLRWNLTTKGEQAESRSRLPPSCWVRTPYWPTNQGTTVASENVAQRSISLPNTTCFFCFDSAREWN